VPTKYCIDTSALLDGWHRYYPPDIFPGLWRQLEGLIERGDLIAPEEVLVELERKDDEVHGWARNHARMFLPIAEAIQIAVAEVLRRFERLVNTQRNRSLADPWVIALAQVEGGATVVTGEHPSGSLDRPRIPDVCGKLGLPCISLLQLIRTQGWTFGG